MSALLTNSRLACFRACPRRHFLRYEIGLRPIDEGYALRFGSAFHAALEARDKGEDVLGAAAFHCADEFDLAAVDAALEAYAWRWSDSPLEVVATELAFDLPITNPETGAEARIFRRAGKIDRIVRLQDGRLALQEYKTTSADFSAGSDYWVRLRLDQQISLYLDAARELGYEIETVLYDVTGRPANRPLRATPEDQRKYTKAGTLYANQRAVDETPEEFRARVLEAMMEDRDRYFARIEIARLDDDVREFRAELWQQQQAIRDAQRTRRWFRNPESCIGRTHTCEFLNVCGNRDIENNVPAGFQRVADVHPELSGNARQGQACQATEIRQ